MKIPARPFSILVALIVIVFGAAALTGIAQQAIVKKNQPTNWAERKAQTLKPLTGDEEKRIDDALPAAATAKPKKDRHILVFYRCETFVHASITAGNEALKRLGEKTGAYSVEIADEYDVFTSDSLAHFDAVLFNNTTSLDFPDEDKKKALMAFVKSGKGIIGIHAAADNFYKWPEAAAMIGGQFNGHPWTANGTYAFKLDDPKHVLNASFDGKGFWHSDEIYQYKPDTYVGPEKLRLLVSLDMSKPQTLDVLKNPKFEKFNEIYGGGKREVPVSWLREFNGGRVFYTNFGHRSETFWKPEMLRHYLDGIQYALGDLEADATPTAQTTGLTPALAPAE